MMEEQAKTGKFYYSIGEVAAMFDVNTSTIRYWEKEFDVLRLISSPREVSYSVIV